MAERFNRTLSKTKKKTFKTVNRVNYATHGLILLVKLLIFFLSFFLKKNKPLNFILKIYSKING